MNNKFILFYKPFFSLSRIFNRNAINSQIIQNLPQKTFPERILIDLRTTEHIWRRSKNNTSFNKYLYQCLEDNSELLTYVMDIIHCASNRNNITPALVYDMVKTFGNYIEDNNIQFSPTVEQSTDVLSSILKFKNFQLTQLVCNVFKLHGSSLDCKMFIKNFIQEQKLIEATFLVSAFHLQKEFDLQQILFPLLLEGNMNVTVIYMKGHPDIQSKAAKFLDEYLNSNNPVPESYAKPRKLYKTLSSLVNVFKIPLDNCPNLQFIRSKGAINILVHRRAQQLVSNVTWEEMIKSIVRDNEDLKRHLIKKLIYKKDMKTAFKMAKDFNLHDDPDLCLTKVGCEIPAALKGDVLEDLESSCEAQENFDIYDISEEYLKFALEAKDIKVINNKEDFVNCINEISKKYNMTGIDSEWKPQFGLSRERLSLIQLAVHDKVYILDVLVLSESLQSECWDKLLDEIFGNPNLIKLGCGIMSDVHMILDSIKGTKGKAVKFSHILDMALFYEKLQEVYPVEMCNRTDKPYTKGLSSLCDIILGKPLNKENRLCDWEKRPLMEKQLEYAALDAHCLLQMYDKLKEESLEKNINFEHLSKVAIVVTTSQWKPKRKYKGTRSEKTIHVQKAVPIEHLKVVIDSSFEDQGKELRKLGADIIIVKKSDSIDKVVEISNSEARIVICSEKLHLQIKNRVKEGFCYYFSSKEEVKVAHFLNYFNVQISTKMMFSRCIICNSNDGLKLSSEDLKKLHDLHETNVSINSAVRENLTYFCPELQSVLSEILNSDKIIEISPKGDSLENECSFLCKACGHIS